MNKKPVRRSPLVVVACALAVLFCHSLLGQRVLAQTDALEDGVTRLARKAAALPHEKRMVLLWTNHSGLSEERVERLRAVFAAQLEAEQVRFTQGETAPPLRVAIEQTTTQIVFTATVPGEGSINVVIEEVRRAAAGMEGSTRNGVRLQRELLWRQEAKILSAAMMADSATGEKKLAVLSEEAILVYRGGPENWTLQFTKALPAPRQAQRSARGQLMIAEDSSGRVGILLPGKRCEAGTADESAVTCASLGTEWPSGRLMALPGCGTQTLWLKSDGSDWTSQDRLLLRNAGAGKDAAVVAELGVGGPVISISAAESAGSATVVVRDLGSGNYEVYRVALACGD
ncbi:MAG TPA: hypothetical protein VKB24_06680 [Candidatus Acidoferrum sp.]|nr:hypothetical protein [Candidatus Acidoferrum sp.]